LKKKILSLLPNRIYLELKWLDFKQSNSDDYKRLKSLRTTLSETNHSYKGFDDTKSIFIHTPKCAGVSVSKALYGNLAGGHTTLEEYLNVFEPRHINTYFKFTFVRNPWDRLVSAYYFLKKGGWGVEDATFFKQELEQYNTFEEFVENWLNEENIWKFHHVFRPQSHYILDKHNKVKLDFIGRLENITEDFDYICKKIGVNCQLEQANQSSHANYRLCYNKHTADIVGRVYAKDIELLQYKF